MAKVNKISSFKSFTEIRKQESVSKLREENNLKRQESVGKIAAILDELGLTSFEGLEEDQKESIISKIFGDVSEEEIAEIEVEVEEVSASEEVTESDEPKCTNRKGHLYKQIDKDGTVECVHCGLRNSLSESVVIEESVITERKAKFKVGDTTENSIGSEVEIIAIDNWRNISKQFKKDMGVNPDSHGYEDTAKGDYYLAKIVKSEEGDEGDLGIFPVEYDYANYWGLGESLTEAAKLMDEKTGKIVKLPYKTKDFRGDPITVKGFTEPYKASSSGRIQTDRGEFFPGVANCIIVGHKYESMNEAKKFKPGDMWSSDFDYEGMLKYGLKVNEKTPIKMLNKLFDSATDVNYHTPFRSLGIAIDWIEDGDKKGAKDYIKNFHDDIKKEMKDQGIK